MTEVATDLTWMTKWAGGAFEGRALTKRPYAVEFEGGPWSMVTNGHALIGVQGASPFEPDDASVNFAATVGKVLAPEGVASDVDLGALRAWASPPTPAACAVCAGKGSVECDECSGDGVRECSCHCGDEHLRRCDCERGMVACTACNPGGRPRERGGVLYGINVNRNLLEPLNHLDGETATVWAQANDKPLLVVGPGWRLAVMPLRVVPDDAPRFPRASPEPVSGDAIEGAG